MKKPALPKSQGASRGSIILGLLLAVFFWGGSNVGVKYLVNFWPPMTVGSTRFLFAGLLMLTLLRWTDLLGTGSVIPSLVKRRLWWRGGLSLAAFISAFNFAVQFTAAAHVALYLAISPIWALLWEGCPEDSRPSEYFRRFVAALLALSGVVILFLPALQSVYGTSILGEFLGLTASGLWTLYGRQCRLLGQSLSGAEVSAHTMWRAGILMLPLAVMENIRSPIYWDAKLVLVQCYCIVAGGFIAFALWNYALRHWRTSLVYLFSNLIPVSTMLWAHFFLGEPFLSIFWLAMALIISGVLLGQGGW